MVACEDGKIERERKTEGETKDSIFLSGLISDSCVCPCGLSWESPGFSLSVLDFLEISSLFEWGFCISFE